MIAKGPIAQKKNILGENRVKSKIKGKYKYLQSILPNIPSLNRTLLYCHQFSRNWTTPFKAIEQFVTYYYKRIISHHLK